MLPGGGSQGDGGWGRDDTGWLRMGVRGENKRDAAVVMRASQNVRRGVERAVITVCFGRQSHAVSEQFFSVFLLNYHSQDQIFCIKMKAQRH